MVLCWFRGAGLALTVVALKQQLWGTSANVGDHHAPAVTLPHPLVSLEAVHAVHQRWVLDLAAKQPSHLPVGSLLPSLVGGLLGPDLEVWAGRHKGLRASGRRILVVRGSSRSILADGQDGAALEARLTAGAASVVTVSALDSCPPLAPSGWLGGAPFFDVVVSDNALQELADPTACFEALVGAVAPGALVVLLTAMHGPIVSNVTFFHFTPVGAALLLASVGFEVVEHGELSSAAYIQALYADVGRRPVQGPGPGQLGGPAATATVSHRLPADFWFLARLPGHHAVEHHYAAVGHAPTAGAPHAILGKLPAVAVAHAPVTGALVGSLWEAHHAGKATGRDDAYLAAANSPLDPASSSVATRDPGHLLTAHRDYPRVPIVLDFARWAATHNFTAPRRLLTTDPSDVELWDLSAKSKGAAVCAFVHGVSRSGGVVGDLHTLDGHRTRLRGGPFDLAVVSQTLEHLYDPLLSMINVFDQLAPGGLLFTSTPSVNRPHMTPTHFRHYSPLALSTLLVQAGFEIVETGQWGNGRYLTALFELGGMNWPSFAEGHVQDPPGSDTVPNDPLRPVQAWVLARRPATATAHKGDKGYGGGNGGDKWSSPDFHGGSCGYVLPTGRKGKGGAKPASPFAVLAAKNGSP